MHNTLNMATQEFKQGFTKGWIGAWRYGYFAPITAVMLAITRPGSYFWHIRALYRMCYWRGSYPIPHAPARKKQA